MTRIYKIIGVLLLIAVLVTACGKTEPKWEDRFTTEDAGRICVGIKVGEEGYYSLWADAEVQYFDGKLDGINPDNLTLLAFKHSENWDGGYYVYDRTEIEEIISILLQSDDKEMQIIADRLMQGLLMTEAST